jgi:rhodanese-related sulfurtransferase
MNDTSIPFIATAFVAVALILRKFGGTRKMPTQSIIEKIKAGARVVDVRSPDEFADGAYPKARNIPLAVLGVRMNELEPKDKPIVLYCASGARSAQAARILKMAGFTDVVNAGGLDDMPQ